MHDESGAVCCKTIPTQSILIAYALAWMDVGEKEDIFVQQVFVKGRANKIGANSTELQTTKISSMNIFGISEILRLICKWIMVQEIN